MYNINIIDSIVSMMRKINYTFKNSFISDNNSLICRALVTGNFEEAVDLCIEGGRVADALVIASLGSVFIIYLCIVCECVLACVRLGYKPLFHFLLPDMKLFLFVLPHINKIFNFQQVAPS